MIDKEKLLKELKRTNEYYKSDEIRARFGIKTCEEARRILLSFIYMIEGGEFDLDS